MAFDLVVRGGLVVDGSGGEPFAADVAVKDGRIAKIGRIPERGRQDIDADGLVVSPGFVDGHTHMDAQVFWDRLGRSSCYHGVTSVVMGNCGFTLAPARPTERPLVVRNLERAEDMPPEALALGIDWSWESFPEFLDAIDALPKAINYGANIGHSALRTWAMGERAFEEEASESDLSLMERELRNALHSGAVGLTTSRALHMTSDGRPVASRVATWDEVVRLVSVLGDFGGRVFQTDLSPITFLSEEPAVRKAAQEELRALALDTGVPVIYGLNKAGVPEGEGLLEFLQSVNDDGGKMFGMTHSRGISHLWSFKTRLPFDGYPVWSELRAKPLSEQAVAYRDPATRARLVAAVHDHEAPNPFDNLTYLERAMPPNPYVTELAEARGVDPTELIIDLGLASNFGAFFMDTGARRYEDELLVRAMKHPATVMTFSDSGAHVQQICDCSIQTHLLGYWTRQRQAFTLPEAVRMLTSVPASIWGIAERGLVREGMVADLNVFDAEEIAPALPTAESDLPGGGVHLQQKAVGIEATVVGGEVILRRGEPTGALPGQLLRSGAPR